MNRKTFLSTLLAIVSAPFLGKSKEKDITKKWANTSKKEAPLPLNELYTKDDDFVTIYVDDEPIACRMASYTEDHQEPPFPVTILQDTGSGFKPKWQFKQGDGEWTTNTEFKV